MAYWRFGASILTAFASDVLLGFGFLSFVNQIWPANAGLAAVLGVCGYVSVVAGFFVHSVLCIYPYVVHGAESIEHIFGELYAVPEKIKRPYFKIKILELLLYLEALELPEHMVGKYGQTGKHGRDEKPYFYRTQVEKVKAVQQFLILHMDENFTQEELSRRFDIPLTPLKNCFKSVFGASIGNYLMEYRMNQTAVFFKTKRKMSVAEIAGCVGYDSPSKFAAAFRRKMGMTSMDYRNRIQQ